MSHFRHLVGNSREKSCCTQKFGAVSRGALVPYWFHTALSCQTLSNNCNSVEINYEVGQKLSILPHSWDKYPSIEDHPPCSRQAMKQIQGAVEQDPQDAIFLPKSKVLSKLSDLRYSDVFLLYMVRKLFLFRSYCILLPMSSTLQHHFLYENPAHNQAGDPKDPNWILVLGGMEGACSTLSPPLSTAIHRTQCIE